MKIRFAFMLAFVFSVFAQAQTLTWKGIFIAGDNSIPNFDNGRHDLTSLMSKLVRLDSIQLTSTPSLMKSGVLPADFKTISSVFRNSPVGPNEGCFIHMTSHGAKHQGFYLALSGILTPDSFAQLVNFHCKNQPTIILISACYSGQFITENLKGPNRIIMTAAIDDRPSFGCSADTRYTYWDECLLNAVSRSRTWLEVSKTVKACIQTKEAAGGFASSYPQSFFGSNTAQWTVR